MLEALEYEYNCFVTLTYADENLPADGSVDSLVLQRFIKKLRKRYALEGCTFRYYGVGEYGETGYRPHYHLALFGFPACLNGSVFYDGSRRCCAACEMVFASWGLGRVQLGSLTQESSAYIAGYVAKKWVPPEDGYRPPFARMSNRPGIGAGAMDDIASALLMAKFDGADVPNSVRHGAKQWPLGRYLVRRLRERIGRDKNAPQITMEVMAEALQELRTRAYENSRSFKQEVVAASEGSRARIAFWEKVRDGSKTL